MVVNLSPHNKSCKCVKVKYPETRVVLDPCPLDYVNYNVLTSLDLLNIENRVNQQQLNHAFNIFNERYLLASLRFFMLT